jgi:hypothetical protein
MTPENSQTATEILQRMKETGSLSREDALFLKSEHQKRVEAYKARARAQKPQRWTETGNIWRCQCGEIIGHIDTMPAEGQKKMPDGRPIAAYLKSESGATTQVLVAQARSPSFSIR